MTITLAGDAAAQARRNRIRADLALLLVAMIWGGAFVVQRLAAAEVSVYFFNGLRFLLAAAALAPIAWSRWLKDQSTAAPDRRSLGGVFLAGGIMVAGAALQQAGLKYTTAGNAGFITGLYVVIIPLILGFGMRQKVRPVLWVAAGMAAVGLFLLSTAGKMQLNPGDMMEFVGAFFWALHVIVVGRCVRRMNVLQFAVGQYAVCGLINLAIGTVVDSGGFETALANGWMLAYAGLISVGVGYTLQAAAQRIAPPADAAIILSGEAVFAALSGWIFLHEALSLVQLVGCAIMLGGMLLAQSDVWMGRPKPDALN